MEGRLKVTVSVDGDRGIFVGMAMVLAGVVVVGGRMVLGVWGEGGGEHSSHSHNNQTFATCILIHHSILSPKKKWEIGRAHV